MILILFNLIKNRSQVIAHITIDCTCVCFSIFFTYVLENRTENCITTAMKLIMNTSSSQLFRLASPGCASQLSSTSLLVSTQKINIICTILIILVGLVGNALAVCVFAHKKFRSHSSSIYMLCLAISDGLFLLVHFFEDTLRTYIDVYLNGNDNGIDAECKSDDDPHPIAHSVLRLINITDQFDATCRLVNYFRYFLRFISAYIIVAFTIQRAIDIYNPLSTQVKYESIRLVWAIVGIITALAAVLSAWVPFVFGPRELELDRNVFIKYCDVHREKSSYYFTMTIVYVCVTMLVPIIVIFLANSIIIFHLIRASKERRAMSNAGGLNASSAETSDLMHRYKSVSVNARPSIAASAPRSITASHDSNKITNMLIVMSLSYAILNLPYFISWSIFFYKIAFGQLDLITRNYLFATLNICEIFYILNYGIHFFIYCAWGKKFRTHLTELFSFCIKSSRSSS